MIPQDSRNQRRVLPSTRWRLTRLGGDGTGKNGVADESPDGTPWTTRLVPGGPGRSLACPARRRDRPTARRPEGAHSPPRRDRTRPAALVCDLRRHGKEIGQRIITDHNLWNRYESRIHHRR